MPRNDEAVVLVQFFGSLLRESPADVLTAELVARVFGVGLRRWADPDTGRTHLSFDRLATDGTLTAAASAP
ncbi:MAG: hypothetical protein ACRDZ4_16580 [Egibacteraceae bacterium]